MENLFQSTMLEHICFIVFHVLFMQSTKILSAENIKCSSYQTHGSGINKSCCQLRRHEHTVRSDWRHRKTKSILYKIWLLDQVEHFHCNWDELHLCWICWCCLRAATMTLLWKKQLKSWQGQWKELRGKVRCFLFLFLHEQGHSALETLRPPPRLTPRCCDGGQKPCW